MFVKIIQFRTRNYGTPFNVFNFWMEYPRHLNHFLSHRNIDHMKKGRIWVTCTYIKCELKNAFFLEFDDNREYYLIVEKK